MIRKKAQPHSLLITDIKQLLTIQPHPAVGSAMTELGIIEDAAIAVCDGKIVRAGKTSVVLKKFRRVKNWTVISAKERLVTPGLVDPHTHLVFAGQRVNEFEKRLSGVTYHDIAARGGGIRFTVGKTREATKAELRKLVLARLQSMLAYGTTTTEVKSGYGLSLTDEVKCLEVIREMQKETPLDIVPTFLGAHEVPDEFQSNRRAFIELLCHEMLPVVAKRRLAVFSDIFTEIGFFDLMESHRIQAKAREFGFKLKFHVEELSPMGGAELAGRMKATSADHLEYISGAGIAALKQGNTVGVLLPGVSLFLGLEKQAPARRLIEEGVPVALGTDFNPGTSPTLVMPLIMSLGCLKLQMSPAEVWTAATINSACAIGKETTMGSIHPGKQADLVIWNAEDYREIPYHFGMNLVHRVIKKGQVVF